MFHERTSPLVRGTGSSVSGQVDGLIGRIRKPGIANPLWCASRACRTFFHAGSDVITHAWDGYLSDAGFVIQKRSLGRSVEWRRGAVNVNVSLSGAEYRVELNIERRSNIVDDHKAWLSFQVDELQQVVQTILQTMRVDIEDISNG